MSKVAVVYWSGTGNTEAMANAVATGAEEKGAEVSIFTPTEFSNDKVAEFDSIAFGCPAMGAEELEDSEFEPMFSSCLPTLSGKKVALFGSYGWGDGEWMRTWEETTINAGVTLATESFICTDFPDDDAITACKELGSALA
ncbi:MAG: flavodoxin [Acutalibacteraceae bacterium]|nr:flavodoxin [Acutalibacteraceae bacterium]